jgi:Tol biopolymer transport system component
MTSEVAIFDLETETIRSILQVPQLVEAPNWTPDGKALIINGNGRLYRVDLTNPSMVEIDTGFATGINNDHGISPDGTRLVISDSIEFGSSCIYTVPVTGGVPRQVTENVPSYWHGWSPDGENLAYVGKRKETYQIYTCPVGGGAEIQLTKDFDHCDGPDYTPDGEWVWFNGERFGQVDLWRVRPDGSDIERMTTDGRVNWFPHPAPDGQTVLYLAYEAGVKGHPRDQNVELRIMPASGGEPKVLCSLYGGQGTINVPCWAPDSKQFAFVRYER